MKGVLLDTHALIWYLSESTNAGEATAARGFPIASEREALK